MDDEVLACGGTVAGLKDKKLVHVIYATDGARPYAPVIPWRDSIYPPSSTVRMAEAREGMALLGVPEDNLHFLGFPEGKLKRHNRDLSKRLEELLSGLSPTYILVPFRYDRHPDHLAVNRVVTAGLEKGSYGAQARLFEYFVYFRWQLLPGRDVRAYIRQGLLTRIPVGSHAARKRAALVAHKSQTTPFYYAWQERPNVTETSIDEVCRKPEYFLRYDPQLPGTHDLLQHGGRLRAGAQQERGNDGQGGFQGAASSVIGRSRKITSPGSARPGPASASTPKSSLKMGFV